MNILFCGNRDKPQIKISDSYNGLISLAEQLRTMEKEILIKSDYKECDIYPYNIKYLYLKENPLKDKDDLMYISLKEERLIFEGTKGAFSKLREWILYTFHPESPIGQHIHLDYFEGNNFIAPTNCYTVLALSST